MTTKVKGYVNDDNGDLYVVIMQLVPGSGTMGTISLYPFGQRAYRKLGTPVFQSIADLCTDVYKNRGDYGIDNSLVPELSGMRLAYSVTYPDAVEQNQLEEIASEMTKMLFNPGLTTAEVAIVLSSVLGAVAGLLAPVHEGYDETADEDWTVKTIDDIAVLAKAYSVSTPGQTTIKTLRNNISLEPTASEIVDAALQAASAQKH